MLGTLPEDFDRPAGHQSYLSIVGRGVASPLLQPGLPLGPRGPLHYAGRMRVVAAMATINEHMLGEERLEAKGRLRPLAAAAAQRLATDAAYRLRTSTRLPLLHVVAHFSAPWWTATAMRLAQSGLGHQPDKAQRDRPGGRLQSEGRWRYCPKGQCKPQTAPLIR